MGLTASVWVAFLAGPMRGGTILKSDSCPQLQTAGRTKICEGCAMHARESPSGSWENRRGPASKLGRQFRGVGWRDHIVTGPGLFRVGADDNKVSSMAMAAVRFCCAAVVCAFHLLCARPEPPRRARKKPPAVHSSWENCLVQSRRGLRKTPWTRLGFFADFSSVAR